MKRNLVRLICAALALALCLGAWLPALAAQPEYTMAGKLLKQLWAGSGFSGTLEVRDSLLVVETVQRKRFLGFLWKTKRVKSREIDVVSKNPYTDIVGVESIRREG